jgi:hypothetical protein
MKQPSNKIDQANHAIRNVNMSTKIKIRKFMRREVQRTTTKLGKQMMKNTLALPWWKRTRIALIIIFKREW